MRKVQVLLLLVILGLFTGCSGEKKVVNLGLLMVPNDAILAKEMGLFEEKFGEIGYDVEYFIFDSGTKANIALKAEGIDFATMGNINGLASLADNADTEMIWIHETLGSAEALVVKTSAGISTIADLAGKNVYTPFSSTSHYILLNVLKNAGIEDQVTVSNMTTSQIVTGWEAEEEVVAAYTWQPTLGDLIEDGGQVLIDSADMAELGFKTANIDLVRKSLAEEHPEIVKAYIECMHEANEYFKTNRTEAISKLATGLGITTESVELQVNGTIWISLEDMQNSSFVSEYVSTMYDQTIFMKEQDLCDRVISREEVAAFINNEYALLITEESDGNQKE